MNWLEEIEARWAKATPGPWHWYHWKGIIEVQRKDAGEGDACPVVHWQGFDGSCRPVAEHNRNASAIAHAPEDVARLIAEVKALREAVVQYKLVAEMVSTFVAPFAWTDAIGSDGEYSFSFSEEMIRAVKDGRAQALEDMLAALEEAE